MIVIYDALIVVPAAGRIRPFLGGASDCKACGQVVKFFTSSLSYVMLHLALIVYLNLKQGQYNWITMLLVLFCESEHFSVVIFNIKILI